MNKDIILFFSDYFHIEPKVLDDYGIFNISLVSDLPLFIDPFLLFNSSNDNYQKLHNDIINYLSFLKDKSAALELNKGHINLWYKFSEVKQTWLGFSGKGNSGSGLGKKFAETLHKNLNNIFYNFGNENITKGSHIEKLCLISDGVGKDLISDFTTNLIKGFLAEYTQNFAINNIDTKYLRECAVDKAYFNYTTETWVTKNYKLPVFNNDYVLLTPKNILTKDESWINKRELFENFYSIPDSIPNESLRQAINNYFCSIIPAKPSKEQEKEAIRKTILKFKELIDYYVRYKEDNGKKAFEICSTKVKLSEEVYLKNFAEIAHKLFSETDFLNLTGNSYLESLKKVHYLKQVIENNAGYRLFYDKRGILKNIKEEDVQILYKLTFCSSLYDVNREVNNGFGPVDFKVSKNNADKTLIEFKLAKNTKLKSNLKNQLEKYAKSDKNSKTIKVIFYFNINEEKRIHEILTSLDLLNKENVITIDARNDNKHSASTI